MTALVVNLKPFVTTTEELYELCAANPELRIERSETGEIVMMSPTGGTTGSRNTELTGQLWYWNGKYELGRVFDSSTGFQLPNGATRSPDSSWVTQERWDALTTEEQSRFVPLCPDFVIELRSPTDQLEPMRDKMREYMTNGAQLGWLIDPSKRRVEIYRIGQPVETLEDPQTLSGEPILPGFEMKLNRIFM